MAIPVRSLCLGLWGALLLLSFQKGRLDLLVRAIFHPWIAATGVDLILLAGLDLRSGRHGVRVPPPELWSWLIGGLIALAMLLVPPSARSPTGCGCC